MYIQNFISKQRTVVTIIEKIHLEIIHNLVTENWEKFYAMPLPTHWAEESEQRCSWRTGPRHTKPCPKALRVLYPKPQQPEGMVRTLNQNTVIGEGLTEGLEICKHQRGKGRSDNI